MRFDAGIPMRANRILPVFTIALLVVTAVTVFRHIQETKRFELLVPDVNSTDGADDSVALPNTDKEIERPRTLLVTGVSSQVPQTRDYRLIKSIPWQLQEVSKWFNDAGPKLSCDILPAGTPSVESLATGEPGVAGPLGRIPVVSINLQVGEELGEGLPSVTRGIIEDYLKAHRLNIQPTLYRDENDRLVVSPKLKAAFVRIDTPKLTSEPEGMIRSSVAEFRTIGAFWESGEIFEPGLMRTMVLAFRYTIDTKKELGGSSSRREFELIFVHVLPGSTVEEPRIAVFATSDGRSQFHLLDSKDSASVDHPAAVTADVRFADSALLGMYPKSPVVTRVTHRSLLTIPTDLVKAQLEGFAGDAPEGGFSGFLDVLYERAMKELSGSEVEESDGADATKHPDTDPPSNAPIEKSE